MSKRHVIAVSQISDRRRQIRAKIERSTSEKERLRRWGVRQDSRRRAAICR